MKIQVLVITLFVLSLSPFAFAQNLNGVQLNDGTLIYGDVYEKSQDSKWINIKKKDGSNETIRRDDVLKFLNNESAEGISNFTGSNTAKTSTYTNNLERKSGFGLRASYVNFSNDDYTLYGINVDTEIDDAFGFGANYTYFVNNNFSFELSADYIKSDVELSALGISGDAGEVTQVSVLFSGRVHPNINSNVIPYLSAGFGYFFNDIDSNRTTAEALYGAGAEFDVDNSFGVFIGGGVEYFLSNNISLNLDLKYIWTEIETSVNKAGFTSEDFGIDPFVAGLGIKYYF